MRGDRALLQDILDAIQDVSRYVAEGKPRYDADELVRVWMIRHLEIMGEAAARLSEDLRASNTQVPWRDIIGMRNILIHDYAGIDEEIVWNTVAHKLPELEEQMRSILEKLR